MRYSDAYELILVAIQKHKLSFPVGENLLNEIFDRHVENVSLRVVKKRDSETFTVVTDQLSYVFTKTNVSHQITRVQVGTGAPVPFLSKKIAPELDGEDISNSAYYIDTDVQTGAITGATSANPIVITSAAHGLDSGDFVIISEIVGLLSAAAVLSEVNGIKHVITKIDANSFSVPIDGSGYTVAYSSGGKWQEETKKIVFTKSFEAGDDDLVVSYYALPEARTSLVSRIDLPDTLVIAALHYSIADLLALDDHYQLSSGRRGLGLQAEQEYFETISRHEPAPYMPSPGMPDFSI